MTLLSQVQLLEQNLNSVRARIIEASNVLRSLNDNLRFLNRFSQQRVTDLLTLAFVALALIQY